MGAKGSNRTTTNTSQSYTPDPNIRAAGYQALSGAQTASQAPFQMPVAPVAGFSPFQEQAFNQIQGAQGMSLPYFDDARQFMYGSASPISEQNVAQYYNPMAQNVTNQLQNIFGQQNRMATSNAVRAAGGVGADRIGVAQANLANQQGLAAGQIYSSLYDKALAAAQQQKQMMAGAGYGLGQLGPAAQTSYLQGTGALAGSGAEQQQLAQAQQNAIYQNRLAQIAYPFQTPQYLAGITGSLAPALGGSTQGQSVTTTPSPSPLNQILGIGGALLGGAMGGPMGAMAGGSLGKGAGSLFGGGGGYGAGSNMSNYAPGGGFEGMTPVNQGFGYVPTFFKRGGKVIDLGKHEYADGGSTYGKIASQHFANTGIGNPYADADSSSDTSSEEYADGGNVDDQPPPLPGTKPMPLDTTSVVPKIQLRPGAGHAGANLNLKPQVPPQQSNNTASQVASTVGRMLPMLLAARGGHIPEKPFSDPVGPPGYTDKDFADMERENFHIAKRLNARGGPVNPFDIGQGFQEGGDVYPDEAGFQPPADAGESWSPELLQGIDAPMGNTNPHWTMSDLTRRAGEFYPEKLNSFMSPNPDSPLNVQRYIPKSAGVFSPAQANAAAPASPLGGDPSLNPMEGTVKLPANPPMPPERPLGAPQPEGSIINRAAPVTRKMESGSREGDYQKVVPSYGPDGRPRAAYGAYGIMGENVARWSKEMYGEPISIREFLDNPQIQDAMYRQKMGEYIKKYGVEGAGRAWLGGEGSVNNPYGSADRFGSTPGGYGAQFASAVGREPEDGTTEISGRRPIGQNPFAIANKDMRLEDYLRSPSRPYPDATARDWGQNLVRSPWSSLIVGGARMAQTVGPVGSALGAGIEAGMGHLEGQRKSLRTEEDLNMKADALFQHAKQHLDKYQRMTPYEDAISKWREAKAESPTAMIKNAKWLVDNGIAPDLETAHRMVSSGINQPAVLERAIRAEKANLAKTPEAAGLSEQQLEDLARKRVQERFETFSPRTMTPGASRENPLPYEPDEKKRKAGMYYYDADGTIKKWIA